MAGVNAGLMFGAPIGELASQENFRDNLLTGLRGQETLGKIAMQPLEMRLHAAQAEKAEIELQQDKKFAAMMAQRMGGSTSTRSDGSPMSMADQLDSLASMAMGSGSVKKGMDLLKTSALLRSREATAEAALVRAKQGRLAMDKENANFVGRVFGDAKTPEDWAMGNEIYSFMTGRKSPMAEVPFSPEIAQTVRQNALDVHQRVVEEDKKLTRDQTEKRDTATEEYRKKLIDARKTLNDIRKQREERLAKAGGGKPVTSPNLAETNQAKRLIKKDFPDLDETDISDASFSIAADARARRRSNPGLSADQALQQALVAARQAGDFQAVTSNFAKDKTRFIGGGKTVETAVSLPMDGKEIDSKRLVKGRYYVGAGGRVAKWNGQKMEIVRGLSSDNLRAGGGSSVVAAPDREDSENDDSDEEE